MSLPVAVLAGGLATRLRPVTKNIPKSLVPVAGKPFILHQLELLRKSGVRNVVLCVGYRGEQIQGAVGDGTSFGMEVRYAFDGPVQLGTGGALRKALPLLGDAFFVLYGDSYLPIDYGEVEEAFRGSGLPALMTVYRNSGRWDTSNVMLERDRVARYDKTSPDPRMEYIDYGLGVLRREVLACWPEAEPFDLARVYSALAEEGRLAAFVAAERFYEIGSAAGLRETDAHLRSMSERSGRHGMESFTARHLAEAGRIIELLDAATIDHVVELIAGVRDKGGRLFILGVGGGAAHASHAVNDFRKLAGIESYAPTDNVSELTARVNDDGWDTSFARWLEGSHLDSNDLVFVISVGGGDLERNISPNLVRALDYATGTGCAIAGIVGRDGGYTAKVADACVVIPTVNPASVTPHTEAFQAVIWHLMVSHPRLQRQKATWESAARA